MAGVHADSWLTNPTKERRSVLKAGAGNFDIASVMESSTLYPAAETGEHNLRLRIHPLVCSGLYSSHCISAGIGEHGNHAAPRHCRN